MLSRRKRRERCQSSASPSHLCVKLALTVLMTQAVKPNSRNALLFESWLIRHARARECATVAFGSADISQQKGCGQPRDDAPSLGPSLSRLVHTASRAGRGRGRHRGRCCESGGRHQSQSARRSVCSCCSTARVMPHRPMHSIRQPCHLVIRSETATTAPVAVVPVVTRAGRLSARRRRRSWRRGDADVDGGLHEWRSSRRGRLGGLGDVAVDGGLAADREVVVGLRGQLVSHSARARRRGRSERRSGRWSRRRSWRTGPS